MGIIYRFPRYELGPPPPMPDTKSPKTEESDERPPRDYVVRIKFDNLEEIPASDERRRVSRKSFVILLAFLAGFALAWSIR